MESPENADMRSPEGWLCFFAGALAKSVFRETSFLVEGGMNHEKENHTHLSDDCPWDFWNDLRRRCYSSRGGATSSSWHGITELIGIKPKRMVYRRKNSK